MAGPIESGTGCIPNQLRADVMRSSMENKNLLASKGSIYVGTGETTTVGGQSLAKTKELTLGSSGYVLASVNGDLAYTKIADSASSSVDGIVLTQGSDGKLKLVGEVCKMGASNGTPATPFLESGTLDEKVLNANVGIKLNGTTGIIDSSGNEFITSDGTIKLNGQNTVLDSSGNEIISANGKMKGTFSGNVWGNFYPNGNLLYDEPLVHPYIHQLTIKLKSFTSSEGLPMFLNSAVFSFEFINASSEPANEIASIVSSATTGCIYGTSGSALYGRSVVPSGFYVPFSLSYAPRSIVYLKFEDNISGSTESLCVKVMINGESKDTVLYNSSASVAYVSYIMDDVYYADCRTFITEGKTEF